MPPSFSAAPCRASQPRASTAEAARSIHPTVDEQYMKWILDIEARPENQSGADKTAEWHAMQAYLEVFRHAREVRRKP